VERRELKLKKRNIEDTKDSEGNELLGFRIRNYAVNIQRPV